MVLNRSPVLIWDFILYLNYGFMSVITAIVPCLYNICTLHSFVFTVWLQRRWGTKPVTLRWRRHCPVRTGSKTVSRWADAWRANLAGCFLLLTFQDLALKLQHSEWVVCCTWQPKLQGQFCRWNSGLIRDQDTGWGFQCLGEHRAVQGAGTTAGRAGQCHRATSLLSPGMECRAPAQPTAGPVVQIHSSKKLRII